MIMKIKIISNLDILSTTDIGLFLFIKLPNLITNDNRIRFDGIWMCISEILNFFSIIFFFFFEFQSPKIITIQESYLKRRFEFKNFSETSLQSESSAELYFFRKFNFFYLESKLGTISNMDALVTYTLKNIM